jgi:hypothetical protein
MQHHVHVWRHGFIYLRIPAFQREGLARSVGTINYKFCSQCRKVLL